MVIYTTKSIKHKAQKVIREHKTNNVSTICKNLNISRLVGNLGTVNGFLQYFEDEDEYLIHINENASCRNFVIAHELGHFFLHKKLNSFKLSNCSVMLEEKLEQQANIFASELLVTDKMILEAGLNLKECSLNKIASYFKVPPFIIKYKLDQMKFSPPQSFNFDEFNLITRR